MNKLACRYRAIQFMPYSETGEFANAGAVLACPQTGYFGFQLQTRKTKRVTDFFSELPREVYRRAVAIIDAELVRVQQALAKRAGRPDTADHVRQVMAALTHPREAMVRFDQTRVLLTQEPQAQLERLFAHHVGRAFAAPEYVEKTMERRIRNLLDGLNPSRPFRAHRVDDDDIHAHFSLVQLDAERPIKIIQPLQLSHTDPMGIYEHGDAWRQRIRRLRQQRNQLPADVRFAVTAPGANDTRLRAAYEDVRWDLQSAQAIVVNEATQSQSIGDFALH